MLQPCMKSKRIQITVSRKDYHVIIKCVTSTSQLQNILKKEKISSYTNMTEKKQNLICQFHFSLGHAKIYSAYVVPCLAQ